MRTQSLSRRQRIVRSSEFGEAYSKGRKFVGRTMVLWRSDRPDGSLRLGVVTGRKVGQAVSRVRARRLMREAFRRVRSRCSGACDVVLIGRANILKATWAEINEDLEQLARRANLIQ